jgi:hypothetical protein
VSQHKGRAARTSTARPASPDDGRRVDPNCDGRINFGDSEPFVALLSGE